jgi:hypothetical protein
VVELLGQLDLDVRGNVRRLLRTGSNVAEFLFLWCRSLDQIRHTGTDVVGPDQEDHNFPEVLPIAEVCTASLGPGLGTEYPGDRHLLADPGIWNLTG